MDEQGISDDLVFARAQDDGPEIVTDNIAQTRREHESRSQTHHGLIYALNTPFNHHRSDRVIGQMVNALAYFLSSSEAAQQPFNRAHYLREVSGGN